MLSHSVVSDSLHVTPWTVSSPNSLSIEFSRQECWSGLPFPFSRGSSQPRDWACISSFFCIGRQILYHCTTWEHKPRDKLTFTLHFHHHIFYCIIVSTATAAESLQSCPTLCDPRDGSPPGSPVPGTLQARTLEWVAISYSNACKWKVKVKSLSRVRLLVTPWTAAHQAPPFMGFSRQEYWSGVPLPSPNSFKEMYIWSGECSHNWSIKHVPIL